MKSKLILLALAVCSVSANKFSVGVKVAGGMARHGLVNKDGNGLVDATKATAGSSNSADKNNEEQHSRAWGFSVLALAEGIFHVNGNLYAGVQAGWLGAFGGKVFTAHVGGTSKHRPSSNSSGETILVNESQLTVQATSSGNNWFAGGIAGWKHDKLDVSASVGLALASAAVKPEGEGKVAGNYDNHFGIGAFLTVSYFITKEVSVLGTAGYIHYLGDAAFPKAEKDVFKNAGSRDPVKLEDGDLSNLLKDSANAQVKPGSVFFAGIGVSARLGF